MVAQRWLVQSAAKGIAVARADFYPRIDLQATAGLASATTFGNFFTFVSNDAEGHSLGAAIYLPIFEGGKLQGRYGAAVANYDAAVETYNRSVLTAMQQVADQVVSLQSLATQQDDAEKSVAEARSAFGLADRGYRSGITEFLNVLVTQATLLRQRQQLALIQARRLDAWTLLMQSLGGGLESSAPLRADAPADDSDGRHAP
jgi:outer membrane protein TolC